MPKKLPTNPDEFRRDLEGHEAAHPHLRKGRAGQRKPTPRSRCRKNDRAEALVALETLRGRIKPQQRQRTEMLPRLQIFGQEVERACTDTGRLKDGMQPLSEKWEIACRFVPANIPPSGMNAPN